MSLIRRNQVIVYIIRRDGLRRCRKFESIQRTTRTPFRALVHNQFGVCSDCHTRANAAVLS